MIALRKSHFVLPLIGAGLLGGCASYTRPPLSYSYLPAPCDAPGALRAVPVTPPDTPGAATAPAPAPTDVSGTPPADAPSARAGDPARARAPECLIAVVNRGPGPGGYYPGGYGYPYGYYGSPFRGGLGIGIGFGGHGWGGHSRGHRGGHGGRHH